MSLWPKRARRRGPMFYIKKIFLSETTKTIALIFCMQHHLVDPYQVRLNCAPGAKNGPAPRVIYYIGLYMEYIKIFLSETTRPRALIFGLCLTQLNFYQVCSNNFPVAKNEPILGVTCFTMAYNGNKWKQCLKPRGILIEP